MVVQSVRLAAASLHRYGSLAITRSSTGRATCLWAGAASVVFASSVPATLIVPPLGHLLLGALFLAVGLPGLRFGRPGAWGGALLSTLAFAGADIADGVVRGSFSTLASDLVLVGILSAIAALLLGEMGHLTRHYRRTADRANASERRYNDLFDGLPTGLLAIDADNIIQLANREARRLFDLTSESIVGHCLDAFVSPQDWYRLRETVAHPGNESRIFVTLRSGRRAQASCSPDTTCSGLATLVLWDIEEELLRNEELSKHAAAFQCLQEGVILTGLDGRITFSNPAASRILGYGSPHEAASTPLSRSLASGDGYKEWLERGSRTGWSGEIMLDRPDGTAVPARVTTSPVRVDGSLIGTVSVVMDLSEQRSIAARAAVADRLATLGRLVATAAHEINNPLAAILSNAELLQTDGAGLPTGASEGITAIVNESRRAGRIVRDLLSFARQTPVARAPVNLCSLVGDVLAMRLGYLTTGGIQMEVQTERSDVVVTADADQLKQVLLNMIVNAEDAVRHWSRREIAVRVSQVGQVAMVFVDDSGPGVPGEMRDRIFEPFVTTKPLGQGTGLGLSVSYGIIKEHGGHIWIEESPLRGARFVIQLPIATECVAAADRRTRPSNPPEFAVGRRVLVVDDEGALRSVARRILTQFGHHVEVAANGDEALALVRKRAFDVIVSDLRMPEKSGQELFEELQREKFLVDTRFVVATGDAADAASFAFIKRNHLPVLLKPFDLVSLLDAISGGASALSVGESIRS